MCAIKSQVRDINSKECPGWTFAILYNMLWLLELKILGFSSSNRSIISYVEQTTYRSNTILLENVQTIKTQESESKHDPSAITHTSRPNHLAKKIPPAFVLHPWSRSYTLLYSNSVLHWCLKAGFIFSWTIPGADHHPSLDIGIWKQLARHCVPPFECHYLWMSLPMPMKGADASICKLKLVRYKRLDQQQTWSHPNETHLEIKVSPIQKIPNLKYFHGITELPEYPWIQYIFYNINLG